VTTLSDNAATLVGPGRGILAADESISTMSKRLEAAGVAASETSRRDYREVLLTGPGLSRWVSGIILCDETLRQSLRDGTPVPVAATALGIMPGIKVDTGVVPLPNTDGETITQGLDGLAARMEQYAAIGAVFAKWRAVLYPAKLSPRAIHANAHSLARYAAICQEAGIVPIVEPEVLMDGDHSLAVAAVATSNTLHAVFEELDKMGVDRRGIVLKPNMVIAATGHRDQTTPEDVASHTVAVLRDAVPADVPGIAFLSGGQSNERACDNLAAINREAATSDVSWRLTFSFGRALVDDALRAWHGQDENKARAQEALAANCARASAASDAGRK